MPLPDREPPRDLPHRRPRPDRFDQPPPMLRGRLGPKQEHDNLFAARNDVGMYSCPAMFQSIVRELRAEPGVPVAFSPFASDHLAGTI